jgi:tetratricopeptide (TPR) repeat protein
MGDFNRSIEFYVKALDLNPKLLTIPNLNHEYGFTYIRIGEFQKAREVFEKMLEGKDDLKARGYRSLALLSMYTGKLSEAINQLHESILINKTIGYGLTELRDRMFLASIYRTKRMIPEFYEELNKVDMLLKSTKGMEPWWYFIYGKFLVRDGKVQNAEKVLSEISARVNEGNKSDKAALNILKGEIQLLKGNPAEAIDLIETGISVRHDCFTVESKANYYYATGDPDKAITSYEEIINASNSLGWEAQDYWIRAHFILGKLYEEKGNRELAIKYYNDFINIWKDADPDIPDLNDAKSRLAKLQNQ